MHLVSSGNESDAKPMSMEMLEDIRNGSQSRPSLNRIDSQHNICDCIK